MTGFLNESRSTEKRPKYTVKKRDGFVSFAVFREARDKRQETRRRRRKEILQREAQ